MRYVDRGHIDPFRPNQWLCHPAVRITPNCPINIDAFTLITTRTHISVREAYTLTSENPVEATKNLGKNIEINILLVHLKEWLDRQFFV